jgi:pyruvate formate lyase activating enzyme
MKEQSSIKAIFAQCTKEGVLYKKINDTEVKCFACGHKCRIINNREGVCKVRFNKDGILYVPHNYVSSLNLDPIEKKPFYHVRPGSLTLSFGMLGCDYKCSFCQNWNISQTIKDESAISNIKVMSSSEIVEIARKNKSKILTSTYNEPLITSEWAIEIFKEAEKFGIEGAYVSNGNASEEVLEYIKPFVKYFKVDLKSFNEKNYQKLGGKLKTVLDSIQNLYNKEFWIEIVTLIIPDYNDSEKELMEIAKFISSISKDIPWHVTAFHPDYKMEDHVHTNTSHLLKAVKIGIESGLNFVYAGNIPGQVKNYENTYCPNCSTLLVDRIGYRINKNIIKDNSCPKCLQKIPGIWN